MSLNEPIETTNRRKFYYVTGLAAILFFVVLGVIAGNVWLPRLARVSATASNAEPKTRSSEKDESPIQPSPQQSPTPERITAELLVLTPRGFEPNEITRPAGRVLLAIVNKAEFPNMILRLERANGTVLRTLELPRNRRRLSIPITLTTGRYRIIDINRPRVVCNIEITP